MKRIVVAFLIIGSLAACASSPALLPFDPEVSRVDGLIENSHVTAEGSVFLAGEFSMIDGVPRPGIAKLSSDGRLDRSFRPEVVARLSPELGVGSNIGGPLFVTAEGTLLHATYQQLVAYRSDGTYDRRYEFLNKPGSHLEPVVEQLGVFYFVRTQQGARRLEVYDTARLERVSLASQKTWPGPLLAVAPAENGMLWVIGGREGFFGQASRVLFRIHSNGVVDAEFEPLALPAGYESKFSPRLEGGFLLHSRYVARLRYWPRPVTMNHMVEWYSPEGELERTENLVTRVNEELLIAEEADSNVVHSIGAAPSPGLENDSRFAEIPSLVRLRPDGTRDPEFAVPIGDGFARSLHRLPDGRLQYSHIQRMLLDGTPDPTWRIPMVENDPSVRIVGALRGGRTLVEALRWSPLWGILEQPKELLVLDRWLRRDRSFQISPNLPPITGAAISSGDAVILSLGGDVVLPDGSLTRLVKLAEDGSVDQGSPRYRPPSNSFTLAPDGTNIPGPPSGMFVALPLPDGKFLIDHITSGGDVSVRRITRHQADGSLDEAFSTLSQLGNVGELLVLESGGFVLGDTYYAPDGESRKIPFDGFARAIAVLPSSEILFLEQTTNTGNRLWKWDVELGFVDDFRPPFLEESFISSVIPVADGKLVVNGYRLVITEGEFKTVLLHADGSLDSPSPLPDPQRVLSGSDGLRWLAIGEEILPATFENRALPAEYSSMYYDARFNRILVGGDFNHLESKPRRGLAALGFGSHAYSAWARATLPDGERGSHEDPDGDGFANLHEYVVGSDPGWPDRPANLEVVEGNPISFRLRVDPMVEGVELVFEISDDLHSWQVADAAMVTTEFSPGWASWRLGGAASALFGRVRFIESAPGP